MNRNNGNNAGDTPGGSNALVPGVAPGGLDRPTTDGLIEAFLDGRNKNTAQAYRADVQDFAGFLQVETASQAAALLLGNGPGPANGLVLRYRAYLMNRDLSAATINRRLAALRSVVKLARTLGLVVWELEIPSLKSEAYRDTRGPGLPGVQRMFDALAGKNDGKTIRDRAILRLLFDRALRRGEVEGLDLEDLDVVTGTLAVKGKGRTAKETMSLPAPTLAAVKAWVEVRGLEPGPLFLNFDRAEKGQRLTASSIYRMVRDLGKQVGIRARPHGLRHSGITASLDETKGDLRKSARYSRHKNLQTLTVYDDARTDDGGEVAAMVAALIDDRTQGGNA